MSRHSEPAFTTQTGAIMLETGLPPQDDEQEIRSVSPLTSHRVSRSSSPGISHFDGTPPSLLALSSSKARSRSTDFLQDMAVKSTQRPRNGHQELQNRFETSRAYANEVPALSNESDKEPKPPNDATCALGGSSAVPSLSELTHLIRLEKYQSRRSEQLQHSLYYAHSIAARTSRLLHATRSVQRTLAECIRTEDKPGFVNLFNALHDAVSDCSTLSEHAPNDEWSEGETAVLYPTSFLDNLPEDSRVAILDFLTQARNDSAFVAERLASLTHKELLALLPEKGVTRSSESVFGSSPRTSSRTSRHLGYVVDGQTELLSTLDYGCPLETLIHALRGTSNQLLEDDENATEVWSTVCARLISEQKPGSEKFVPAVIDAWAQSSAWPGKDRLGIWLSQTLQSGSFLLEQPNKQSFRLRVQGRREISAEEEARAEKFYADSVASLLAAVGDPDDTSLIPEGARKFCQAICRKLQHSQGHQHAFPNFVLSRWLFSSFLPDAITLPEMHGLLVDHFVSEIGRQRILRETASRLQKAAFDVIYSWKLGTVSPPETIRLVHSVAGRFQDSRPSTSPSSQSHMIPSGLDHTMVCVNATDVSTLINALYPTRRPESLSSERDPSISGLQSSASSISGFSLFPNMSAALPTHDNLIEPRESSFSALVDLAATTATVPEMPLDSGAPSVDLSSDSDRLQQVCIAIADLTAGGQPSCVDNWCVLTASHAASNLRPMRHQLLQKSSEASLLVDNSLGSPWKSRGFSICKNAIELLLADGSLSFDYAFESISLEGIHAAILKAFNQRIASFEERSEFVAAHSWYRKLQSFLAGVSSEDLQPLVQTLCRLKSEKQDSFARASAVMDSCDTWIRSIRPHLESYDRTLALRMELSSHLRAKMWYTADARTSAVYDEARSVAAALKVMGVPKKPAKTRLAPPLRHWSGSKLSNTNLHLKTEAQVLELISAPPDHGGPNKLSDDPSKSLPIWMERNSVENLCRGEERLHRFCMEVRKTVEHLTSENSTLWSNALFSRERPVTSTQASKSFGNPLWSLPNTAERFDLHTLRTNLPPNLDALSSTSSHPLSARSSHDYLEARSPTMTNKSSAAFWSPVVTDAQSPSSATSLGTSQAAVGLSARRSGSTLKARDKSMAEQLRQHAISLLLSDLGSILFSNGSETDQGFWTGLGGDLAVQHLQGLTATFAVETSESGFDLSFDFDKAFKKLALRFSSTCDPYRKLHHLFDIDTLLAPWLAEQSPPSSRPRCQHDTLLLLQGKVQPKPPIADTKVEGFRRLFCNSVIRPSALFRDLQYIAALVPSAALESTPQGRAFWNAAVAITGLKQEIRQVMIETADNIIAYHSNNRGHGRSPSTAQQERDSATFTVPSRTPSAENVARYTMSDAAYLLQITAKEGDAVAQRELATLYLTHPELMDHVIAPFSRPRDVFKEELESKWRKNQDPNRCDPATMCVAHHWMSLSSKGGDALAKEYLRQREEMDRLGST